MADTKTTLHIEGDLSTNVYPNVQSDNIPSSAVTTEKIADSAVTAAKLASNAVTSAKIADSAVTAAKLASNAVTAAKIADSAVTNAKLAGGIATSKLSDSDLISAAERMVSQAMFHRFAAPSVSSNLTIDGVEYVQLPTLDVVTTGLVSSFGFAWSGTLREVGDSFPSSHRVLIPPTYNRNAVMAYCVSDLVLPSYSDTGLYVRDGAFSPRGIFSFIASDTIKIVGGAGSERVALTGDARYFCYASSHVERIVNFDMSGVTKLGYAFSSSSLVEIDVTGICVDVSIQRTAMEHDALVAFIGNLATVTESRTLTMGDEKLALLSDEEKAVATDKGWTLA